MRWLWLALVLAGCPKPIPGPQPPRLDMNMGLPACPSTQTVTPADVCDGLFTSAGLACAKCSGGSACLDTVDVVYCIKGTSCTGDAACAPPPDVPH